MLVNKKTKPQNKKIKQERQAEYLKERELFLKENPVCQIKRKCKGKPSTDVHHSKGRGEWYLDKSTWFATCRSCHIAIEYKDRAWAVENGFIKKRI